MLHTIKARVFNKGAVVKTGRGEVRIVESRGIHQGVPTYAVEGPNGQEWIAQVLPTLTVTGTDYVQREYERDVKRIVRKRHCSRRVAEDRIERLRWRA